MKLCSRVLLQRFLQCFRNTNQKSCAIFWAKLLNLIKTISSNHSCQFCTSSHFLQPTKRWAAFRMPFKLCSSLRLKRCRQYFWSPEKSHLNIRLSNLMAVITACRIACKAKLHDLWWSDISLTIENLSSSWLYLATEAVLYFDLKTRITMLIWSQLLQNS